MMKLLILPYAAMICSHEALPWYLNRSVTTHQAQQYGYNIARTAHSHTYFDQTQIPPHACDHISRYQLLNCNFI